MISSEGASASKKPVNPRLRDLMAQAMATARPPLNIEELGEKTGLERHVVGRIVRGETRRIAPEQANALVAALPLAMEELLAACGYNITSEPLRIPRDLRRDLQQVRREDLPVVQRLVRGLLALSKDQPGAEEP